jgi:hypothetical protein
MKVLLGFALPVTQNFMLMVRIILANFVMNFLKPKNQYTSLVGC